MDVILDLRTKHFLLNKQYPLSVLGVQFFKTGPNVICNMQYACSVV